MPVNELIFLKFNTCLHPSWIIEFLTKKSDLEIDSPLKKRFENRFLFILVF